MRGCCILDFSFLNWDLVGSLVETVEGRRAATHPTPVFAVLLVLSQVGGAPDDNGWRAGARTEYEAESKPLICTKCDMKLQGSLPEQSPVCRHRYSTEAGAQRVALRGLKPSEQWSKPGSLHPGEH